MNKQIRTWLLRLTATGAFIICLLVTIVVKPMLTYAGKTGYGNYTIYHNQPLNSGLTTALSEATVLLKKSELNDTRLKLDICLDDGSLYPRLVRQLGGQAFARGFYDKVVVLGSANYTSHCVELNGYRWNLPQLLAHEMTHCLQLNRLGLWHSNPVANIPMWKWEGYPEYIARQGAGQAGLRGNIDRLGTTEQTNNNGWISFEDGTGTVITYYKSWLLMQYCMDIKRMTYAQVIADTVSEGKMMEQMMMWYKGKG